jgi:hypothetical protein
MIPSGYKEDVVYSQIPTSGAGDLSFTRASNGTRINSAGLVEVCPWNLVQYSNTFTNGVWVTGGYGNLPTLTANAIANPVNGLVDAWGATFASAGTQGRLLQLFTGLSIGVPYTYSMYVKAGTKTSVSIYADTATIGLEATFNLSTGVVTSASSGVTATITSMTNGWYFLTISNNILSSGNGQYGVLTNPADDGSCYIYGAQLNIGSTAKPYFPTTDRLNVPRLTYQNGGGGCPSLLLEKQSTNISYQSTVTSFGSGANDWLNGNNSPASINQTTGIDGTQNGAKYTKTAVDSDADFFYKNQVPVTSGTTYTVSGYIKLGTASNAVIVINNTSAWNTVANGSIVCSTANGFSTTSWKRFELTITGPSTNKINIHYGYHLELGVTAQATGTFFLDGLQVEASSYATSLINTTSASATRVADLSTSDTIQTAQTFAGDFTIFADFVPFIDSTDANGLMILGGGASGLGTTYQSYLWFVGSNVYLSGDGEVNIIQRSYSMVVNQRVKIALTRVGTTVKMFVNGAQVGASNTSSLSITIRSIGWSYNLPTYQTKGKINQVVLSATGFSDADCQSLTTI